MNTSLLRIIFFFVLSLSVNLGFGQCKNNFQFPNYTLNSPTNFDTLLIGNPSFLGDFSKIQDFQKDKAYIFYSDSTDDYITLRSFDNSAVLAYGTQPLTFVPSQDLDLTVHFNNFNCGSSNLARKTYCAQIPSALDSLHKVGINRNEPLTTLDISGKIRLSDDAAAPKAGMIRYYAQKKEFQGYNGDEWIAFAPSTPEYGKFDIPEYEDNEYIYLASIGAQISEDAYFGEDIAIVDDLCFVSAPGDTIISNVDGEVRIFKYNHVDSKLNPYGYLTFEVNDNLLDSLESFASGGIDSKENNLIVGCFNTSDSPDFDSGKALIFEINNNELVFRQALSNPTESDDQKFATQVAIGENLAMVEKTINGILDTVIIDVFKKINNHWTYISSIHKNKVDMSQSNSLTIDNSILVIGYPSYDDFFDNGLVDIYHFDHANNSINSLETLSELRNQGNFGSRVLLRGNTLAVSDVLNNSIIGPMKLYMYYVSTDTTYMIQEIDEVNSNDFTFFAKSTEIYGNTLLVTEPWHQSTGGFAYIYKFSEEKWQLQAKLKQSVGEFLIKHSFGNSIAFHPNFIIIGSPKDSYFNNKSNVGRVIIYYKK